MLRIGLHSVPRSGSTWLGSILDAHPQINYKFQPLFSYEFKGFLDENSKNHEILDFFNEISKSSDDFLNQVNAKEKGHVPTFLKENIKAIAYKEVRYHHILKNMLIKDSEVKIIGLIRNPNAVLYSWYNAPKEFKKELGWIFKDEWFYANEKNKNRIEEFNGYLKWKEVANLFLELKSLFPERFYLINYDNLLSNTIESAEQLMKFVGLTISSNQISFIQKSKEHNLKDSYSVYKLKENDFNWKDNLPSSIVSFIKNDLINSPLEVFLNE